MCCFFQRLENTVTDIVEKEECCVGVSGSFLLFVLH